MAPSMFHSLFIRHLSYSFKGFYYIITTSLALIASLSILFYISSTSNLFHQTHPKLKPYLGFVNTQIGDISLQRHIFFGYQNGDKVDMANVGDGVESKLMGNYNLNNNGVFHDRDIFLENFKMMNKTFKIYVYPHSRTEPFAHALLPVGFEPKGNYASESFFRKILFKSHFITKDPNIADLFFLPFSISRLRHDPRIGVEGIQDFVRDYVSNISRKYPYWNRTGGADHFYVACHSVGQLATEKAVKAKLNAIQVVCSSSYFLSNYVAHKDASLPQIWPRQRLPPDLDSLKREKLAFFAGSNNSPVRQRLIRAWENDSEIFVHSTRLSTPYNIKLLTSKFCLHVKGYEVNTARISDALYYGCVPVIIANYYDLPFSDILNWKSFSIIVATLDIPVLKNILKGISFDEYLEFRRNVLNVRQHFQWHVSPVNYDAFYMVMYELWLRRGSTRIEF